MTLRSLALIVLLAAGALIWVFNDDPESEVRAAHAELRELIRRASGESGAATALNSLNLRDLFADPIEISGAADGLAGSYTPEDLAGLIARLRTATERIELTFSELSIEFPASEVAVTQFSAELLAESQFAAADQQQQMRAVTSRMQQVGSEWLFTEIILGEVPNN